MIKSYSSLWYLIKYDKSSRAEKSQNGCAKNCSSKNDHLRLDKKVSQTT